ncbi:RNA polymerase sigma factor [Lysobacter korlensis]|uniref:RNA polymerase sigma factor n=1 Tax=Lysobacter korlensis TaxID=553636 RepID=A0ABV6RRK2_9GAMM
MSADRDLVTAVLAGDVAAFERLVVEHHALCWRIVVRIVRDPEHAHDICQETFLRVHRSLSQYRHESALRTWIGRIAYSLALRHLERQRGGVQLVGAPDAGEVFEAVPDSAPGPHETLASAQAHARLHRAIDALPPLQRSIVRLYHIDEMPISDIADITGVPTGTIKSHLFRIRARLRGMLDDPSERMHDPA